MSVLSSATSVPTVLAYRVRRAVDELTMLGGATFGALILGVFATRSPHAQFSIAATLYMLGVALILAKPRMGAYLIIFAALVGEPNTMPWYPFTKNGSSAESILFISNRVVATPLEGYIVITLVAILLHRFRTGERIRVATPFTVPLLLLAGAVSIGVVYGVLTGGAINLAINQTRAIVFMFPLFLIFVNVFDRHSLRTALWLLIWAVTIESGIALYSLATETDPEVLAGLEAGTSPITHSVAVQMNVVIFLIAALPLLRNSALSLRLALPFLMVPVVVVYAIAERRAAVGGLAIAVVVLMYVLAQRQSGRFIVVAPPMFAIGLAYLAAFWNSTSSIGFPAQAIKSQLVTEQGTSDSLSDLYRTFESFNLLFTIKSQPLLGIGYGKPFPTPIPMADISGVFPLWQYYPHNSVLSLWAFGGVFAISAWLYVGYAGVRNGVRATLRATNPHDVLSAMTGTAIVIMVLMYSYLDITFDAQTMLLIVIGLAFVHIVGLGLDEDEAAAASDPELDLRDGSDARGKRRDVSV